MKTKSVSLLIISVLIAACSNSTNPVITEEGGLSENLPQSLEPVSETNNQKTFLSKEDLVDLDKEYGQFNTKALTYNYLVNKLKKLIENAGVNGDGAGGLKLVRDIEYARFKYKPLFCALLSEDSDVKDSIDLLAANPNSAIFMRKSIDTPFNNFLNSGCNLNGTVMTLAGSGANDLLDETGTLAKFNYPYGVAVNSAGTVYVADCLNNSIRKITPAGVVTTIAGNWLGGNIPSGGSSVSGSNSRLTCPLGIAVGSGPNFPVYIADFENKKIRKLTSTDGGNNYDVTTLLDTSDGLINPYAVSLDSTGTLYISDIGTTKVSKYNSVDGLSTLAGGGSNGLTPGFSDGTGTEALFAWPIQIAVNSVGNIYMADCTNNNIRKITQTGIVKTIAGGGTSGSQTGNFPTDGSTVSGTDALFQCPFGVAVDTNDNIYVSDMGNSRIKKITSSDGGINYNVTTIIGTDGAGDVPSDENSVSLTSAKFNGPRSLALDSARNLYVADTSNNKIRKINLP